MTTRRGEKLESRLLDFIEANERTNERKKEPVFSSHHVRVPQRNSKRRQETKRTKNTKMSRLRPHSSWTQVLLVLLSMSYSRPAFLSHLPNPSLPLLFSSQSSNCTPYFSSPPITTRFLQALSGYFTSCYFTKGRIPTCTCRGTNVHTTTAHHR